jgi:hypothetical protein
VYRLPCTHPACELARTAHLSTRSTVHFYTQQADRPYWASLGRASPFGLVTLEKEQRQKRLPSAQESSHRSGLADAEAKSARAQTPPSGSSRQSLGLWMICAPIADSEACYSGSRIGRAESLVRQTGGGCGGWWCSPFPALSQARQAVGNCVSPKGALIRSSVSLPPMSLHEDKYLQRPTRWQLMLLYDYAPPQPWMKVSSLARVRTISAQRATCKPSPPLRLPGAQPRNWGQNLDRTRFCHWTCLRETAPDPASEALIAPALAPKRHPVSDHSAFGSVFLMSRITDQEPREGLSSLGPWGALFSK